MDDLFPQPHARDGQGCSVGVEPTNEKTPMRRRNERHARSVSAASCRKKRSCLPPASGGCPGSLDGVAFTHLAALARALAYNGHTYRDDGDCAGRRGVQGAPSGRCLAIGHRLSVGLSVVTGRHGARRHRPRWLRRRAVVVDPRSCDRWPDDPPQTHGSPGSATHGSAARASFTVRSIGHPRTVLRWASGSRGIRYAQVAV